VYSKQYTERNKSEHVILSEESAYARPAKCGTHLGGSRFLSAEGAHPAFGGGSAYGRKGGTHIHSDLA
jgi:hypothetical protein